MQRTLSKNLFATRTFLALAGTAALAILPAAEGLIKRQGDPWRHWEVILGAGVGLLYGANGRTRAGGVHTPRWLPGPNADIVEVEQIEEREQ